jgi:phage baseplate assembly protein W
MDMKWENNDLVFFDGDIDILGDSIMQELILRIDTLKGEHYLNKEYGCNLRLRVGEQNNLTTKMLVATDIEDALNQDYRIEPKSVSIVFIPSSVLECDITYHDNTQRIGI